MLFAAIGFVACAGTVTKSNEMAIPEKPIEEMNYTPERTTFEVWGPTAESAVVRLYNGEELVEEISMVRGESGL